MLKKFEELIGRENVLTDEPMKNHTTFKIGGPADIFLMPKTEEQIANVIKVAKENSFPVFILGNGSNVLVGDKGIRGAVLCLYKNLNCLEVSGDEIYAGAGVLLSAASLVAANSGLSGLEFASGIPGTIGGAVYMNAGAYGPEMKDVIVSVRCMDGDGNILELKNEECEFSYRHSRFTNSEMVILGCKMKLQHGDVDEIRAKISDLTKRRVTKQPVEKPSAGSTFKRPEGYFAGTLIEEAGLKGKRCGGAEVSEKHAGFIINTGDATAKDVLDLIEFVKKTVYDKNGVMLEPEVKLVGEF